MRASTLNRALLLILALCGFGPAAMAQGVTTASVTGLVTDEGGEPLPSATVIATHQPSGTEYGVVTRNDGRYDLRGLRVGGPYTIVASFVGFTSAEEAGVYLELGDTRRIDLVLGEGAVELDEIAVTAQRDAVFNSERTGVATNLSEERIEALPTVGRDLADFTRTTPQAFVGNDDDDGPSISVAGQNNRYNSIYIDGAVNNDVFGLSAQGTNGGQTGSTPISIDAIEQFQINLSPFDVTQSGFTGAAINAVTRSGSNEFEGSAYYFLRDESLAGKTPLPVGADDTREFLPDFSNNRFGFRVGGPIIKNKLFFFANAELLRSESPQPFTGPYSGASAGRLDELVSAVGLVGYEPGGFGDKVSSLDDDKLLLKLDWNINQNNKLSARYSYSQADNVDAFASRNDLIAFDNNSEVFPSTTNSAAVELNSTFGSQFANKLILGLTTVRDDRGISGSPFPFVQIDDGAGDINIGPEQFSTGNVLNQDIFTVTNNFNWFLGAHTLTAGLNVEVFAIENLFIARNFGFYRYDNLDDFIQSLCAASGQYDAPECAGFSPADGFAAPLEFRRSYSLVDDDPATPGFEDIAGDASAAVGAFDALQVGLYVQDEWQVNPQLRLTGGLRLDVPSITTDPRGPEDFEAVTVPLLEAQGIALNGATAGQAPDAQLYVSPRFGFNYDALGDRTLQLRGGLGVFVGRVPFVWPGGMFVNNGVSVGEIRNRDGVFDFDGDDEDEAIPFIPDPQNALNGGDFGSLPIPSGRLELFEDDFRYPSVFRTALGVDYQLPYGIVGTIEGQYTKTINNLLITNVNLNPNTIVALDGADDRPVYAEVDANGNGEIDAGEAVEIDDRYSVIHRVGTTSEGYTWDLTGQLTKDFGEGDLPFFDGVNLSLSYTYGDAWAINDATSSQINSNWRGVETAGLLNDLELSRSDFSLGSRVLASVALRRGGTSVSAFVTGESGRPFSYTIANSANLRGDGDGFASSLLYVPEAADASAPGFNPASYGVRFTGTQAEQVAAIQAFERFIESSDYLRERRGQYAERNGSRTPFETVVDLRLAQELFGGLGPAGTLAVTLDIFNFTNLLNSEWGRRYVGFGDFSVLEFDDFAGAPGSGDFVPVYELDLGSSETEEDLFDNRIQDSGTYSSRWQMQLGVRYTF